MQSFIGRHTAQTGKQLIAKCTNNFVSILHIIFILAGPARASGIYYISLHARQLPMPRPIRSPIRRHTGVQDGA